MHPAGLVVVEDLGASWRGSTRAPALEHIANRPIVDHVVDNLSAAGVRDVVVASSTERVDAVRDCLAARGSERRSRLRFVERPGPLDLAGAISLAAPAIGQAPCVVHLADGLLGSSPQRLLERLPTDAPDAVLFVHQSPGPNSQLSGDVQDALRILGPETDLAGNGLAGVWLFGPNALEHVADAAREAGRPVDLTRIAEPIAAAHGTLRAVFVDAWCRYVGNPLELLELNRSVLDRLAIDHVRRPSNGNRIEGRVLIDDHACVRGSVIVGPAVIGAGAHVSDAYIGPYTSIGPGVRIEGAEIERSIISPGASIMHVGGRLVTCVVGRNARVFRDFSLPQALRLRVGDGTEVALC